MANWSQATMPTELAAILIGLATALAGILILRMGRQIAKFLLIGGGLAALIAIALAMISQAKATQRVAQATTVAVTGQAAGSAAVTLLAVLLVLTVILALATVGYFWLRARQAERRAARAVEQAANGGWTSGPNALWDRKGRDRARLPAVQAREDSSLAALLIGQMAAMQTMMMTWMQQQRGRGGFTIGDPDVYTVPLLPSSLTASLTDQCPLPEEDEFSPPWWDDETRGW
jgi:uncharacterized membrane protein YciS (DUF1049 family)